MKTAVEIIEWYDRVLPRGPVLLDREEWQTLKTAVLAQRSDNSAMLRGLKPHAGVPARQHSANRCLQFGRRPYK